MNVNPFRPLHCLSSKVIKPVITSDTLFSSSYNCLKGHSITPALRTRMVDWMIEVLTKLSCSGNTFFLSVHLFDKYLKRANKGIGPEKLLLIGAICMVLASKFEDVQSIGISIAKKYIVRDKCTEEELLLMEMEICKVLEFEFLVPLCTDYLGNLCSEVQVPFVVSRTAELILIVNRLEYNNFYQPFEEAASALILACRSLGLQTLAFDIQKLSGLPEEIIEISVIGIMNQLYSYKLNPPKFKLVFRELGFQFESMDVQKIFKFVDPELEKSQISLINYV